MNFEHFDDETHPEKMEAIRNSADNLMGFAVHQMITCDGIHPASALCALIASSVQHLEGMSVDGARLILESMLEENPAKQDKALDMLVEGYEVAIAQIERDEAGETIQ